MRPLTTARTPRYEPRHIGTRHKSAEHAANISRGHLARWKRIRAERRAAGLPETAEDARRLAVAKQRAEREALRAARAVAPSPPEYPPQFTPTTADDWEREDRFLFEAEVGLRYTDPGVWVEGAHPRHRLTPTELRNLKVKKKSPPQ
jgi:hypothetical protein